MPQAPARGSLRRRLNRYNSVLLRLYRTEGQLHRSEILDGGVFVGLHVADVDLRRVVSVLGRVEHTVEVVLVLVLLGLLVQRTIIRVLDRLDVEEGVLVGLGGEDGLAGDDRKVGTGRGKRVLLGFDTDLERKREAPRSSGSCSLITTF